MKKRQISIVIPAYNEEKVIKEIIMNLKKTLKNSEIEFEIIVIDDCSTDNTRRILEDIDDIKLIKNEKNLGYGASLKKGILNAKYDTICTFDADGQHNPEDILKLLKYYDKKDKMVIGERKILDNYKRRILGKIFLKYLASYLFSYIIKDLNSGLRIFDKNIAKKFFHICSNRFSFSTSLTLCYIANSMEVVFVPIETELRKEGKSYVNILSGLRTIYKIFQISLLYKPIKTSFSIFSIISIIGLISLIQDIIKRDLSDTTVILFLTSVIILCFILISEQLHIIKIEILDKLNKKDE